MEIKKMINLSVFLISISLLGQNNTGIDVNFIKINFINWEEYKDIDKIKEKIKCKEMKFTTKNYSVDAAGFYDAEKYSLIEIDSLFIRYNYYNMLKPNASLVSIDLEGSNKSVFSYREKSFSIGDNYKILKDIFPKVWVAFNEKYSQEEQDGNDELTFGADIFDKNKYIGSYLSIGIVKRKIIYISVGSE